MINLYPLLEKTPAFKIFDRDIKVKALSHAYLLVVDDKRFLDDYLKIFAKLIMCDGVSLEDEDRICNLIDENAHADAFFYPKTEKGMVVDDVSEIINESIVKPIEGNKKLFVISHAENLSSAVQNKLLKTLEEPPKNVHILIGATNDFSILQTVKSRTKKLEINAFSSKDLLDALKDEYKNEKDLEYFIESSNGSLGGCIDLISDAGYKKATEFAIDLIVNMKGSKDVLAYTKKFESLKIKVDDLLRVLENLFSLMLNLENGGLNPVKSQLKQAEGFSLGAIVNSLEKVKEGIKRNKFNMNGTMLIEWLFFQILEGKYKWQKL